MSDQVTKILPARPEALIIAMSALVESGRGLAMLRVVPEVEWVEIGLLVSARLDAKSADCSSVLARLRGLLRVLGEPRLVDLLLRRGHPILAPAARVSATMPLSAGLGFDSDAFERALIKAMAPALPPSPMSRLASAGSRLRRPVRSGPGHATASSVVHA
jgi:hypothetical protein